MCRKKVFDQFQYDPKFTLAQDYHFFVRALSVFKGSNLPDVIADYRLHEDNSHKKDKKSHLSFIVQINEFLFETFQLKVTKNDLEISLLINDSNPVQLGKKELAQIENWLLNFKSHCLNKEILEVECMDSVISRVWKELYWKINKNSLSSYAKYVYRYKSWKHFSLADWKFFLKKQL